MAIPKLQAYALPEASDISANKVNWAFEPSRAALLIHDMQEYFLNFWGENSAMMEKVVANIAALRDFCKQNGIPVYYTAQPKEQSDEDRALLNDMWGPGLTRSPEQQQVIAALAPDEDDTVLVKWRYSAFHRSPLEEMLKEMMALAARWRKVHGDIDFVMLAKNPTIDAWWALLSREVK